MIDFNNKKVLFISAHMDDIEFGCGGLIHSLKDKTTIYILALTKDRTNAHGHVQEERVLEEQYQAAEMLGVQKEYLYISDEPISCQQFPEQRQFILEELYKYKKLINPDMIFTPSQNDIHPDHRTVFECAIKAFARTSHFSYEIINSTKGFNPNCYLEITEEDVNKKAEAIKCYKSQYETAMTSGDYFSQKSIEALAIARGTRVGMEFAEAFEIINMVKSVDESNR